VCSWHIGLDHTVQIAYQFLHLVTFESNEHTLTEGYQIGYEIGILPVLIRQRLAIELEDPNIAIKAKDSIYGEVVRVFFEDVVQYLITAPVF
jgi:hypothetical protein